MKVTSFFLLVFSLLAFSIIQVFASSGSGSVAVTVIPPPDLVGGVASGASATVGTAVTFNATIYNTGQGPTGVPFPNFFQIATSAAGAGAIDLPSSTMPALLAGQTKTTSASYVFTSSGTYFVRVCANKSDRNTFGSVIESNTNDNCSGQWTSVTVVKPAITGTIDAVLTGSSSSGGVAHLTITFSSPIPGPITYQGGFDFTSTSNFGSTSDNYPPPKTYVPGNAGCGFTPYATTTTISSGVSSYTKNSICAEPGVPYGYVSKVVFYNVTLPSGYTLQLTPVHSNMTFEVR